MSRRRGAQKAVDTMSAEYPVFKWDGHDFEGLYQFLGDELYSHVSYTTAAPRMPHTAHIVLPDRIAAIPPGTLIVRGRCAGVLVIP